MTGGAGRVAQAAAVAVWFVRLKPYDEDKGHIVRRYTVGGTTYLESHGWYEVEESKNPGLADAMKELHQVDGDTRTPLLFDVCTEEEAREIERQENRRKRAGGRRTVADARSNNNVLARRDTAPTRVGTVTTADIPLAEGRRPRGEEARLAALEDEERDEDDDLDDDADLDELAERDQRQEEPDDNDEELTHTSGTASARLEKQIALHGPRPPEHGLDLATPAPTMLDPNPTGELDDLTSSGDAGRDGDVNAGRVVAVGRLAPEPGSEETAVEKQQTAPEGEAPATPARRRPRPPAEKK